MQHGDPRERTGHTVPQLATLDTNEFGGRRATHPFHQHRSAGFDGVRPAWAANGADPGRRSVSISTVVSAAGIHISIIERDILMLKVFKTDIERLEQAATKAEAELHKIAAQHEAAVALVKELGNEVAEAFADSAPNAEDLQEAHFKAELRAGSLAKAVVTAGNRNEAAKRELAEAKAQAKAEAAAALCRERATALEKAKPAAAGAARKIAEIVGSLPANIDWSMAAEQAIRPLGTRGRRFL